MDYSGKVLLEQTVYLDNGSNRFETECRGPANWLVPAPGSDSKGQLVPA